MSDVAKIWCDGSVLRNPGGPGGWAFIVKLPTGAVYEDTGGAFSTTNNAMELEAALRGVLAVPAPATVMVFSDSRYVVDGFMRYMPRWKARGWKRKGSQWWEEAHVTIANLERWQRLDAAAQQHAQVSFHWVRGHGKNMLNNRADALAGQAMRRYARAVQERVARAADG